MSLIERDYMDHDRVKIGIMREREQPKHDVAQILKQVKEPGEGW